MKKVVLLMGIVALMFGCKSSGEKSTAMDDSHNSRNSLDWAGTYVGTLPCADCAGIDFMVVLYNDNTFILSRTYLANPEANFTSEGSFTWDDKGLVITIEDLEKDKFIFKVGENRLISLDQKGNEIKGELEQNYILDKIDDTLIGKRWKLVELMGQPVVTPEGGKEAFMILRHDGNVSGDFGCNVFNGTYNLRKGDRIHFLPAISTMMMCSNMETEQKFKEVLETVDNYNYIDGNKLVLNRARMAPLARFEIE